MFHRRPIDLSSSHDILFVRLVLNAMNRRTNRRFMDREFLAACIGQVCMGLVNRGEYNNSARTTDEVLAALRHTDRPDMHAGAEKQDRASEHQMLIDFWKQHFGDPKEMERKQAERDARQGIGESWEAKQARQRQEYIKSRLFVR